jgi:citrate lyase subunit beta/citryl-CoA lyase
MIRVRRSLLSVPAINQRAIDKVQNLGCDGVIFDLEDSVAPEKKAEARANLRQLFATKPPEGRETIIRINALSSPIAEEDLALIAELRPDAVLLPKVDEPGDVNAATAHLERLDVPLSVRIWAMMETPKGILNAGAIAATARREQNRLDCFVLGLNDLRKETRVPPRPDRTYLVPWMMHAVLAARAYGLDVIDSVFNDFRDDESFSKECLQGRDMGFDGKMLIHPTQIAAANQAFGPAEEALAEAHAIITAFTNPQTHELNVINLDGRMVERLHLEQAQQLVAQQQWIESRKKPA